MPPASFSPATVVVRKAGFMEADVDQEVVALSVEKGICYGLNPVGSRIWKLIADPISVADICETLVSEYQVDPDTCQSEVIELLEEFRAEGIIAAPEDAGAETTAKDRI